MNKPVVSIIIPTFNEGRNIERNLKAIKNQTFKKVEAIVVDDGSTDDTVALARKYTNKVFPRSHKERSIQRNFGASKASGDYLIFIDADMELTPKVVESCLKNIGSHGALIIPEKTVGTGFMSKIRAFEREMYMGDPTIEVARFFKKKVFKEFKGYDPKLTGTEDYDLPKKVSSKYTIGWAKEYILHHEASLTIFKQLKKKYYYANKSAIYAKRYPDLVRTQGNMLFRKAYLRNWKKFIKNPLLGCTFILVRILETTAAILGYINAVGVLEFIKTLFRMIK